MEPKHIQPDTPDYPAALLRGLAGWKPPVINVLGNSSLMAVPKTALFCSTRCPGDAILRTYDQAAKWRDAGRCIISGFHSPVEKECLRILLRGKQPIIICPARSLDSMRIPATWKRALAAGRLLILSFFRAGQPRVSAELAARRNEFVAALADDVWFAHITAGGQMERLSCQISSVKNF